MMNNEQRLKKTIRRPLGIYVHIPFCHAKCAYCDFCSAPPCDGNEIGRYLNALLLNIGDHAAAAEGHSVDSIFFGGGTPSMLSAKQFETLLGAIRETFKVERGAEISIEANPATVDKKYLKRLRSLGVNRISIGLQSANENELKLLSRIHNLEGFDESFAAARAAKFDNINIDIMYGIPDQTKESFQRTLDYVVAKSPEHISMYALKIEPGTRFYDMRESLALPSDDMQYDMYMSAVEFLRVRGYALYEISNFSRVGFRCRHNIKYWNCDEYLGFGAAAHSYFGGVRSSYTRDVPEFIKAMEAPGMGDGALESADIISRDGAETEYVMLRLRLAAGVNYAEYFDLFGASFLDKYRERLEPYAKEGFAVIGKNAAAFTLRGMYVSNYILSNILDF